MDTRRSSSSRLSAAMAMMLMFPVTVLALENCNTWREECKERCVKWEKKKCVEHERYDCKDVCTDFDVVDSGPTPHIPPTMPPEMKGKAEKKASTVTPPPTPHIDNINTAPLPAPTQSCAGADGKPVKCN